MAELNNISLIEYLRSNPRYRINKPDPKYDSSKLRRDWFDGKVPVTFPGDPKDYSNNDSPMLFVASTKSNSRDIQNYIERYNVDFGSLGAKAQLTIDPSTIGKAACDEWMSILDEEIFHAACAAIWYDGDYRRLFLVKKLLRWPVSIHIPKLKSKRFPSSIRTVWSNNVPKMIVGERVNQPPKLIEPDILKHQGVFKIEIIWLINPFPLSYLRLLFAYFGLYAHLYDIVEDNPVISTIYLIAGKETDDYFSWGRLLLAEAVSRWVFDRKISYAEF